MPPALLGASLLCRIHIESSFGFLSSNVTARGRGRRGRFASDTVQEWDETGSQVYLSRAGGETGLEGGVKRRKVSFCRQDRGRRKPGPCRNVPDKKKQQCRHGPIAWFGRHNCQDQPSHRPPRHLVRPSGRRPMPVTGQASGSRASVWFSSWAAIGRGNQGERFHVGSQPIAPTDLCPQEEQLDTGVKTVVQLLLVDTKPPPVEND